MASARKVSRVASVNVSARAAPKIPMAIVRLKVGRQDPHGRDPGAQLADAGRSGVSLRGTR